jgi:competence protein ComEC
VTTTTRSAARSGAATVPFIAIGAAIVIALGGLAHARPDGWTHVTVLDVGQGDAILVEGSSGGRVLVDGGPDGDRLRAVLDARLPLWDRRLDLVILTHPHEDHAAGMVGLLGRYQIGRFFEPGMAGPGPGYVALAGLLDRDGTRREHLATGGRFRVDDADFQVLWPDPGAVPAKPPDGGSGINNVSIVLDVTIGSRRLLLMGDVEQTIDPLLLARGLPRADLLKVAHHGSGTATTAAFLAAVSPRVAIVSVGAKNRYGHPAPATLERLGAAGARTLRTDRDGSVTVSTNGTALTVSTTRAAASAGIRGASVASTMARAATVSAPVALLYDRGDGGPGSSRGRVPPPAAGAARLADASQRGRRGGRRVPRCPRFRRRTARGSSPCRGGRAPP